MSPSQRSAAATGSVPAARRRRLRRLAAALAVGCSAACLPERGLAQEASQLPGYSRQRWREAPAPIPAQRTITRDDYLDFVERTNDRIRPAAMSVIGQPQVRLGFLHARREAFYYQLTGKEKYARNAMRFIRADEQFWSVGPGADWAKNPMHGGFILQAAQAWDWIRESPSLGAEDRAIAKRWLLGLQRRIEVWEYGAMNRASGNAAASRVLDHWYPGDVRGMNFVEKAWNDWWALRDSIENSSGYNSLWLQMIARGLEMEGAEELHQDPGMRRLAERYLAQLAPIGVVPGYGDVMGFQTDPARWIHLMENWARVYQDGRFKFAAHRIFEWWLAHESDYAAWGNPQISSLDDLMDAHRVADESIAERLPTGGSSVTWRKEVDWRHWTQWPKAHQQADLRDRDIPDKLIFRSGWQPDDSYALFELAPPLGHGHADTASLNAYVSEGSVVLADTPYIVRAQQFHNTFQVDPAARPAGWNWGHDVQVSGRTQPELRAFESAGATAYAHLRVEDFLATETRLDRRILFLGRLGLVLFDTLQVPADFTGAIGPAFQFGALHPKRGANWVVGAQPTLPVADAWKPVYLAQIVNRTRDLLVWFAPRSDARLEVADVRRDTTGWIVPGQSLLNTFAQRAWQVRRGALAPDAPQDFTSVLLPHRPRSDPETLAQRVTRVLAEPGRELLRIALPDGSELWAGYNETPVPLASGPLETDARSFAVRIRNGRATGHWLAQARRLAVSGETLHESAEPRTLERWGAPLPAL